MMARKRKSDRRTNGGVSLKLRRDGSAGGKEEEEVGSREAPVPTITTSPPPSLRQPLPLPVTPNTSLLDLTVTYDYRLSVDGDGPDMTTEELSSMFIFQDSPTVHPPLLPLWEDLGCSPQLPARKRPRTSHPPSPLHTSSTPQQNRFQRLERLAQQLHQCLGEPQEGQHHEECCERSTTLSSPHHHTVQTTLSSPHHHIVHTSPHNHTVQTTLTSPHHHTDQTTLTSPHHHTDHQQSDTIEEDDNMFWSQAADVVASSCWEHAPSPEHPSRPSPQHPSTSLPEHPSTSLPEHSSTSLPEHPSTSLPEHPSTSLPEHPSTSLPEHPSRPSPEHPSTSLPQHPSRPSPQHPSRPSPQHSSTSLPKHPSRPSPQHSSTPLPEHPSTPSLDPFGESDADAFIDQLLSDGISLTTPAKHSTRELKGLPRSSNRSVNSSVSVVQASTNPVEEARPGTGLTADRGVVLEATHGTNVKVACSDVKDGWSGRGVDGSCEQIVAVKCSQREIERKRELAKLRLSQRQRWKPAPANTD